MPRQRYNLTGAFLNALSGLYVIRMIWSHGHLMAAMMLGMVVTLLIVLEIYANRA